jgi:transposase
MGTYVGIDWGGSTHAICVLDEQAVSVAAFEVSHDAAGLGELLTRLRSLGRSAALRIAIERPSGLLIDTLLDAGFQIVPIHPNMAKACRTRYRAAGGKCDRGDAYLLADLLRTDGHRLRSLTPECDAIRALQALVRTRDDLVTTRVTMANQLRALLQSFWAGAASIFAEIDSPIALAFLQRYPSPDSAAHLGEKRLASFLATHRYCGRKTAATLLERLRSAARGTVGELEADAKADAVRCLVRGLATLVAQLSSLSARIEHELAQLPDGQLLMSFPRTGRINAAQILAELGSVRERFATDAQLAAEAGVAPVTHQSGKSRGVTFRWACNHRLRAAITTWADNSRHQSPWAAALYQRARARGARHPHAIRILARAWLRVLWRVWHNHTAYDPQQHRSARQLLPAPAMA